jgi:mRNA interferase HigB
MHGRAPPRSSRRQINVQGGQFGTTIRARDRAKPSERIPQARRWRVLAPILGAAYSAESMRIIARRTLREFVASCTGQKDQRALKVALDAWFEEVRKAHWSSTADVKRLYASASIVTADRIVFNIKGNSYRLVAAVDFEKRIVWIKWIGTHRDYDRIDVRTIDHEK